MSDLGGAWRLSPELEGLLSRANDATDRGDWNGAVEAFRSADEALENPGRHLAPGDSIGLIALDTVKSRIRSVIRENLAVCLANRGGRQAQNAMVAIQTNQPDEDRVKAKIDSFFTSHQWPEWPLLIVSYVLVTGVFALFSFLDQESRGQPLWERLLTVLGYPLPMAGGLAYLLNRIGRWFRGITITGLFTPCEICGRKADYRMNLPGRGEVALCSTHSSAFHKAMEGLDANPVARDLLVLAEEDLQEALRLNPSLEGVEANLREIRNALAQLPK